MVRGKSVTCIKVNSKSQIYPIYIGVGILEHHQFIQPLIRGSQVLIVTQKTIPEHFLAILQAQLRHYQCDVFFLPIGEEYKTLTEWQKIIDFLLERRHQRNTTLIALGGGMVGDIVGFVASCYLRGVNYIQIPTTLIGLVDSSVGGKTGVNHVLGKNFIGAFYQPIAVIADSEMLKSLPQREFIAGMAEVIKYGLIRDVAFFRWLLKNTDAVLQRDPNALQYLIQHCISIKSDIVEQDERDCGVRHILNFGHTFGHALETSMEYAGILHGEAVAMGMRFAVRLSVQRGLLSESEAEQINQLLKKYGLLQNSVVFPQFPQLFLLMKQDKKNEGGKLSFILLNKVGKAVKVDDVTEEELVCASSAFYCNS